MSSAVSVPGYAPYSQQNLIFVGFSKLIFHNRYTGSLYCSGTENQKIASTCKTSTNRMLSIVKRSIAQVMIKVTYIFAFQLVKCAFYSISSTLMCHMRKTRLIWNASQQEQEQRTITLKLRDRDARGEKGTMNNIV